MAHKIMAHKKRYRLLIMLAVLFIVITPIILLVRGQDECSDYDDDSHEDAYNERHPDDGSYLGVFTDVDDSGLNALELPLYSPDSPFNQPIPTDAKLDPQSDERIALLVEEASDGIVLGVRAWTISAYVADENTPRYDVKLVACWSPFGVMYDVPIPDGALPDPVGDGGMAILDLSTGYEYDFWQAEQLEDGTWQASWANRIALDSIGIYEHGLSAQGAGLALLSGLIWPAELDAGRIDHALMASIPAPAAGGPVWPATESDGYSDNPLALPEGARLQLDPNLDLDALGLEPWQRTIAEALQTYGVFIADIGGSDFELQTVNAISWNSWPFGNHFDDITQEYYDYMETGALLFDVISLDDFRVLEIGPQDTNFEEKLAVDESIYGEPRDFE